MKCSKCERVLTKEDFHKDKQKKNGIRSRCKHCSKHEAWTTKLRLRYGMTENLYNEMLVKQCGKCNICHKPPKYKRLSVDHCHTTGRIRALLCNECNIAVGWIEKYKNNIMDYIKYVEDYE